MAKDLDRRQQPLASPHFDELRAVAQLRTPAIPKIHEDEDMCLMGHEEVFSLQEAPSHHCISCSESGGQEGKYLWLVLREDVVCGLEYGSLGLSLGRKRMAHTNFSGKEPAYVGGEMWFRDESSVWINGGSGRFPAQDASEWHAAVRGFVRAGYSVCSAGWDEGTGTPSRVIRSEEWTVLATGEEAL
ncbi:hypothetical protein [Stenotrophomonas maltophilia]|uniref:hypothetical protein n=1 Tax=Stenotrophomonas maltophilia TaxID=40324 RepID=UPI00138FE888|nr:hypothetical protein [Stenotrophomonas maltophilia]